MKAVVRYYFKVDADKLSEKKLCRLYKEALWIAEHLGGIQQ